MTTPTFIELYGGGNGENARLGYCLTVWTFTVWRIMYVIPDHPLSWRLSAFSNYLTTTQICQKFLSYVSLVKKIKSRLT